MTGLHPTRGDGCPLPEGAPHRRPDEPERELVSLVDAARAGDAAAWTQLVERFTPTLRRIARSYRLQPSDVDDVVQSTWLRLFAHIEQLRDPKAVAGWLATTTRREAMRVLQGPVREHLTDDPDLGACPEHEGPETQLIAADQRAVLARALATLPDRHRRIMALLAAQPNPDYRHISATLSIPIGSIGPIRSRSFARLQRHPELRSLYLNAQ